MHHIRLGIFKEFFGFLAAILYHKILIESIDECTIVILPSLIFVPSQITSFNEIVCRHLIPFAIGIYLLFGTISRGYSVSAVNSLCPNGTVVLLVYGIHELLCLVLFYSLFLLNYSGSHVLTEILLDAIVNLREGLIVIYFCHNSVFKNLKSADEPALWLYSKQTSVSDSTGKAIHSNLSGLK